MIERKILRTILKEIISRYDADEDGYLNPKEAFCFLQGFWGLGYSPSSVQLVKNLYNNPRYEAENVKKSEDRMSIEYSGDIPLEGMVSFCEEEIAKSEELQMQAFKSLSEHGYELDLKEGKVNLKLINPPHETYQTLCMRLAKRHLNEPDNFNLIQWLMEVNNGMIEYRERPSKESMKLLTESKIFGNTETEWDNMEQEWHLDELLRRGPYLSKDGLQWSEKFIKAIKEIFIRYDGNNDGKLTRTEMCLFQGVLTGRIPNQTILNKYMQNPTFEVIIGESLENEFHQKDLLKFVFWHGYNEDLNPLPDMNFEPINQESLIFRLCHDIESRESRNVGFQVDLLKDLLRFMLFEEETIQPSIESIVAIRNVLGIQNLQEVFELNRGELQILNNCEEAFQLFKLVFQYFLKGDDISSRKLNNIAFIQNAEKALDALMKKEPNAFLEFLSVQERLEQLRGIPPINNHLDQRFKRSRHISIIPQIIESLFYSEGFTGVFKDLWELMDPEALVIFAIRLAGAVLYRGAYNYNAIISLLNRLNENKAESVLQKIVEQKVCTEELADYYYCLRFDKPYPDILPVGEELTKMNTDQIAKRLSDYCGVSQVEIDDHFRMYKIIGPNKSIASTILNDAKQLQTLGLDRKIVARKFMTLLGSGEANNLQSDPNYLVVKCYTRGHHPDVFHPTHGELSYYLRNDMVGGSADCLIINKELVSEDHRDEVNSWTEEDIQNLLIERLNAPNKAVWEDWDGILYCSDMNPYLIRVACCFEGEGTRYRVDVNKLCKILGLLLE